VFKGRRYGVASNVAVHVARLAVEQAGLGPAELSQAALWVGSSRGNLGEVSGSSKERRAMGLFRASNQLHSEIAAAVSIELGIRGPWHVLSNGCASGLDALGFAADGLRTGRRQIAVVVAVDLPLVAILLDAFSDTGALGSGAGNDPYGPTTDGFLPGEGAAALVLEIGGEGGLCGVGGYGVGTDAFDSVAVPEDGGGLTAALEEVSGLEPVVAVSPHANGTRGAAVAEQAALETFALRSDKSQGPLSGVLFKPYFGHTLGASGLVEAALLAGFLGEGCLPPNLSGLTGGVLELATQERELKAGDVVLKYSTAMGGHHAVVALRALEARCGLARNRRPV
jgi:3-oxoacyl-(acyl-carrier-protein) synthase